MSPVGARVGFRSEAVASVPLPAGPLPAAGCRVVVATASGGEIQGLVLPASGPVGSPSAATVELRLPDTVEDAAAARVAAAVARVAGSGLLGGSPATLSLSVGDRARAAAHPVATGVPVPTPDDMRALGRRLADLLGAGDLVVLTGPLGAGKTVLVQGVGEGLGVQGRVVSPSYVLARRHPGGRVALVHVDAWRLGGVDEVADLDLDTEDAVVCAEWGEGRVEFLADERVTLSVERPADGEVRRVTAHADGGRWTVDELADVLSPGLRLVADV